MNRTTRALNAATTALRQGVASEHQWALVAGRVETALQLAGQGVLPGIKGHLTCADQALQGIRERARLASGWQPVPLDLHELDAVVTFTELHAFQVRQIQGRRNSKKTKRVTS